MRLHSDKRATSLWIALLLFIAACSPTLGTATTSTVTEATEPPPDSGSETTSTTPSAAATPALAKVPPGGTDLYDAIDGAVAYRAQEGMLLPILAVDGAWSHVLTTCSTEQWLRLADVETIESSVAADPGPGFDLTRAVIVVDPGHGGRDKGAKGATGTNESDFNLAIATLLEERLSTPHDVDWAEGRIMPGDSYPAVGRVLLTRGPDGPDQGDVELGLAYRAEIANQAGADALVSIHNNTTPRIIKETPGSDVFYAVSSPGSDRLASLIHQELLRGLAPFGSEWGSAAVSGPKARVDAETGDDFYGLLRRSVPPAVIVEGMYVTNPVEETLLQSRLVQQAYADAVYRGLVRFLTTDETGSELLEPVLFEGNVGSPSTTSCVVPTQP